MKLKILLVGSSLEILPGTDYTYQATSWQSGMYDPFIGYKFQTGDILKLNKIYARNLVNGAFNHQYNNHMTFKFISGGAITYANNKENNDSITEYQVRIAALNKYLTYLNSIGKDWEWRFNQTPTNGNSSVQLPVQKLGSIFSLNRASSYMSGARPPTHTPWIENGMGAVPKQPTRTNYREAYYIDRAELTRDIAEWYNKITKLSIMPKLRKIPNVMTVAIADVETWDVNVL